MASAYLVKVELQAGLLKCNFQSVLSCLDALVIQSKFLLIHILLASVVVV